MDRAVRDDIEYSLKNTVYEYLKNNVFSACSIAVTHTDYGDYTTEIFNYGKTGRQSTLDVDSNSVFDLASLTKPLVVSLSILALVDKGALSLEDRAAQYIDLRGAGSKDIKIIHLLEHSSGLPAHREYFHNLKSFPPHERMRELLKNITCENTLTPPGEVELYSDLGYILLGAIVEIVSGMDLKTFWKSEIVAPLTLKNNLFFAGNKKTGSEVFISTGSCLWSNMELLGIVNDDNCRSIGGVAGHAGLFGSSAALITFIEMLLKIYDGSYLHPRLSLRRVKEKLEKPHGRWVMGFDTPTGDEPSSGRYFSHETLGHLGFTGTSFWVDCRQKIGVVVLTNRVLSGNDLAGIRSFRPKVHDLIMEKLTPVNGK